KLFRGSSKYINNRQEYETDINHFIGIATDHDSQVCTKTGSRKRSQSNKTEIWIETAKITTNTYRISQ
ncbi:hypothetical protein, partial [Coprobacter fastidiosus]|uniref:hypothetical protein n=1 Tax=Coprobacter fastidiosus TaxID=1099853 RepID=UPI0026668056